MLSLFKNGFIYILKPVVWFGISIGIMTLTYWSIIKFISMYCAPDGVYGIISTAFTMGSPLCQAFTQILVKVSEYYLVVWGTMVSSFITWFVVIISVKEN